MKNKPVIKWLLFLMVLSVFNLQGDYTPEAGELEGWKPTGSPRQYVGEDLFLLINGGAEIYNEYGFKRVITREYKNVNGKPINLEVFEMTDSSSAFGMYSFKTGKSGKNIPVGNNGLLEDYYINFWKGRFLVTLTGFDSEKETLTGLIVIARAVDKKIKNKGRPPLLTGLLPEEGLIKSSVKYIKGYLGLFNLYTFGHEDIFGLKEGVMGDYNHHKVFIFRYNSEKESLKWFKNARKKMGKNGIFFDLTETKDAFFLKDKKREHIYIKLYGNYMLVFLGTERIKKRSLVINKIEDNIKNTLKGANIEK